MHLDPERRRIRLTAGELADFRLGPSERGTMRLGRWRAQLGQAWHGESQKRVQKQTLETEKAEFEVSIRGTLQHRGWAIEVNGRIDQMVTTDNDITLREVKTIRRDLPLDPAELRHAYPAYFAQLAVYHRLWTTLHPGQTTTLRAELEFIDISEGFVQSVNLSEDDLAHLDEQLGRLVDFGEARRQASSRLQLLTVAPPFPSWREGQEEARKALGDQSVRAPVLLFEAPTGFGKTGLVLDYALQALRDQRFERIVFLTGKSTGQEPVMDQLQTVAVAAAKERKEPLPLHIVQLRSKAEHQRHCPQLDCLERASCRDDIERAWQESGLKPHRILASAPINLERGLDLARDTEVCPYEIARACLPWGDVLVGDYNYVFAPDTVALFPQQPGFSADRTLLIIDEAHNLASRVADAFSHALDRDGLLRLATELTFADTPPALQTAIDHLQSLVTNTKATDACEPDYEYDLRDHLLAAVNAHHQQAFDASQLSDAAADLLWSLEPLQTALRDNSRDNLLWAPRKGELRLTCLDASNHLGSILRGFGQTVLMSATLRPYELLCQQLGLTRVDGDLLSSGPGTTPPTPLQTAVIPAFSPWREGAYQVALDTRIDTRFRARTASAPLTAETILRFVADAYDPVAVFFSSYAYAHRVRDELYQQDPTARLAVQPRGLDLVAQERFLDDALITSRILFLVLGGSFAEGIDRLGGRVQRAMVVGPALPEVNPVQEARVARHGGSRNEAFHHIYRVPGMTKVNQALGRLVRAPGQTATVLLHGQRFAEPAYLNLLADEYRTDPTFIQSEADFSRWISGLDR